VSALPPPSPVTPRKGPQSSSDSATLSPGQPEWHEASRTLWSLLNASPALDLTCSEYDEDYPSHEWMALHLASQPTKAKHRGHAARGHAEKAGRKHGKAHAANSTPNHDGGGSALAPLDILSNASPSPASAFHIHGPFSSSSSASYATRSEPPLSQKNSLSERSAGERSAGERGGGGGHSTSGQSGGERIFQASQSHHAHHGVFGRASHRRHSREMAREERTSMRRRSSAVGAQGAVAAAAANAALHQSASTLGTQDAYARRVALLTRWSTMPDCLETRLMRTLLGSTPNTLSDSLLTDHLDRFKRAFSAPSLDVTAAADGVEAEEAMQPEVMVKQAALSGAQNVVEFLLGHLKTTYLWENCVLLTCAAASDNLQFAISVAKSVAKAGGSIPSDIAKLVSSSEMLDAVSDSFKGASSASSSAATKLGNTLMLPTPGGSAARESLSAGASPVVSPGGSSVAVGSASHGKHRRHLLSGSYDGDYDDEDYQRSPVKSSPEMRPAQPPGSPAVGSSPQLPLSARLRLESKLDGEGTNEGSDSTGGDLSSGSTSPAASPHASSRLSPSLNHEINPFAIGLRSPVPTGFVANRTFFAYLQQDDEEEDSLGGPGEIGSEEEELRGGLGLRGHAMSFSQSTRSVEEEEDDEAAAGEGDDSFLADPSDSLHRGGGRGGGRGRADEQDASDSTVTASSPPQTARLFSYPGFEELTSFDVDDLLPQAILLMEWKAGARKKNVEEDDEEEEEIAEVRNVRMQQLSTKHSTSSTSASAHKQQPFARWLNPAEKLTSPSSAPAVTSTDSSSVLFPRIPRTYHIWFGRDAASVPPLSDPAARDALAKTILAEFRERRSEEDKAEDRQQEVEEDATILPQYQIEVDGEESDKFNAAFEEDD
jgi:hypothetical protein